MSEIVLRDTDEAFNSYGLKRDQIELWEDGRRNQPLQKHWE